MPKKIKKLEEDYIQDGEMFEEVIYPEPEIVEAFIEPKKEKKKKPYIVTIVSKIYVCYFNEGGYLTRTHNIWGDIKIGETIYL
jgi:hypothetical protein